MSSTYDQFTDRVMSTREGKIQDIDAVARGRIFLGSDAKELGMVDHLGGIEAALADAAEQGDLGDDYGVVIFPDTTPNPLAPEPAVCPESARPGAAIAANAGARRDSPRDHHR